jgi:sulfotransferase family protein
LSKQYLFVGGCARSGTTALTTLINCHSDIVVGYERYSGLYVENRGVSVDLFEPKRFMSFQPGDRKLREKRQVFVDGMAEKIKTARVVGDKHPQIYKRREVFEVFPNAKFIFIIRDPTDVARSFQVRARNASISDKAHWDSKRNFRVGIREWNAAIEGITQWMKNPPGPTLVLFYEDLFFRKCGLKNLFDFIGVDMPSLDAMSQVFLRSRELSLLKRMPFLAREVFFFAELAKYRRLIEKYATEETMVSLDRAASVIMRDNVALA